MFIRNFSVMGWIPCILCTSPIRWGMMGETKNIKLLIRFLTITSTFLCLSPISLSLYSYFYWNTGELRRNDNGETEKDRIHASAEKGYFIDSTTCPSTWLYWVQKQSYKGCHITTLWNNPKGWKKSNTTTTEIALHLAVDSETRKT